MDILGGISDAYDSAVNEVSDAVNAAQQTVSGAVDSVSQTVSESVDTAEVKAREIYEDTKRTVAETAGAVEERVTSAAAWAKHQADSFASGLEERLNPEAAKRKDQEGAISHAAASPATLPQDRPVDLRDPVKRAEFLAQWGQFDKDDKGTETDAIRCQSNTAMAALLIKGGPDGLREGLEKAQKEALERARNETDPDRKAMLMAAAKQLGETAAKAGENKATPQDLDRAADALFRTFAAKEKIDAKTGKPAEGTGGMDAKGIEDLERTLGLTRDNKYVTKEERHFLDPRGWGDTNQEEVNEQIWANLKPGEQAHVSVHGENTYLAQGRGPHGEPIQTDRDGKPYYVDTEKLKELRAENARKHVSQQDSEAVLLARATVPLAGGDQNHAVLFGRTESGVRYVYNPGGNPAYIHEDPRNPAEFDRKVALLIPRKGKDDYYANVTPYA